LLAPNPTTKLEGHPVLDLCNYLFSILAATLHIWRLSPPSTTYAMVTRDPLNTHTQSAHTAQGRTFLNSVTMSVIIIIYAQLTCLVINIILLLYIRCSVVFSNRFELVCCTFVFGNENCLFLDLSM
jgi:hypothetical protein